MQVTDAVLDNTCRSGVAISKCWKRVNVILYWKPHGSYMLTIIIISVRPPGHHAEVSEPCGFCVFNNVALAAKYALEKRGLKR